MEKEKIEKVLALTEQRYTANRNYKQMREMIDDLYNHNYSNKGMVSTFLENLQGSFVYSRINPEDLDDFYSQVFTTIENAWEQICNKHLAIVEHIDKELEAL